MNALVLNDSKFAYNYCKILSLFGINADVRNRPISPQNYDFLLLCGGGDVNPAFYSNAQYPCNNIDTERDVIELSLIEKFARQGKEIIGICRGLQVLNVYFGGTLENIPFAPNCNLNGIPKTDLSGDSENKSAAINADLRGDFSINYPLKDLNFGVFHSQIDGKDSKHEVYTSPKFCDKFNKTIIVNSAHKQRIKRLADSFTPVFVAADGTIEGIASKTLPIVAFQFHPERMLENFSLSGKELFSFALNYNP